ncbi:MAG: hypothetical protein ABIR79_07780 [Candidatus Binatia bacterium]
MLIPIGHDGESLKRWPVVTLSIIALAVVMFVANAIGPQEDDDLIYATAAYVTRSRGVHVAYYGL